MLKVEGYSFNPSVEFVYWSIAGSYHDIADLVSKIQAQKYCLYTDIFRYLFSLNIEIGTLLGLVYYLMNATGICSQALGGKEIVSSCLWFYITSASENKKQTR